VNRPQALRVEEGSNANMLAQLATTPRTFILLIVATLLQTIMYAAPLQAEMVNIQSQKPSEECKVKQPADAKVSNDDEMESLIAKARNQGSVNIIVKLCVDFVPEGDLPNDQKVREQRQVISRTQKKLLKKLSVYKVSGVKKYQFTPLLALQVNAAALSFLKTSPLVAGIEEDKAVLASP
jgi:hypothetical protein